MSVPQKAEFSLSFFPVRTHPPCKFSLTNCHLDGHGALLIMDQAPWHKNNKLFIPENIVLSFQPPYSPELNPVEHFWEHLREKYTANRHWSSMAELEDALCGALRDCGNDPETIRYLTLFDWMVYK